MIQLFWHISAVMMRELLRKCMWHKVDWRKLLLASAIATAFGIFIPNSLVPYPMNVWLLSSPATVSSSISLNGSIQLSGAVTKAKVEQIHPVPTSPILSVNPTVPSKVARDKVSQNRNPVARRRRKRNKANDDAKVVPPVPPRIPPPRKLQVELLTIQLCSLFYFELKEGSC